MMFFQSTKGSLTIFFSPGFTVFLGDNYNFKNISVK